MNSYSRALLLILFIGTALTGFSQQQKETEQQRSMAKMMAESMDQLWDVAPEDGTGNLQILMLQDGQPFSLPASIYGNFNIQVKSRTRTHTSFNPNANGRYVLDGLDPGIYSINIQGLNKFEGKNWEFNGQVIEENGILTLELTIE